MAKKGKRQANAPDLHQILASQQQQPPHNPYYPELPTSSSQLLPPPPYSELSVPLNTSNSGRQPVAMSSGYQQQSSVNHSPYRSSNSAAPSVVIQQVPYDYRTDRLNYKVRSFNNQLIMVGILACLTSLWAHNLYRERPCIFNFTVHKPNKDLEVTIGDVKEWHRHVTYISAVVVLICLFKSSLGFRGKSHSCYMFFIAIVTLAATLLTGYLSYLTFYSPCVLKAGEIAPNLLKTVLSPFTDKLPSPDKGVFGESNVIQLASEDGNGAIIFILDVVNFALYFGAFLAATVLC